MSADPTIARYEGFLQQDPDNLPLLIALGDLYHRAGRLGEALRCFERCLELHPGHVAALGRTASVMLTQHRFAEAAERLRPLAQGDHPDPAVLHNLGIALTYLEQWKEAARCFERARAAGVETEHSVLLGAHAMHQTGSLGGAVALCRTWLEAHPDDRIESLLAVLEMDGGDMAGAHERAQKLLARQPDNPDAALVSCMWSIEQQDMAAAHRFADTVLRATPGSPRGWFARGLVHMYLQEHEAAIAAIETALKASPRHVGTLTTLGWARFTARDLAGAEHTFRQAIEADANFGEAHGGLAMTLLFQRRIPEARREAQVARRLDPNSLGALWARSTLLAIDGNRQAGEALLTAALEKPFTPDGRSLHHHLQAFGRQQAARARKADETLH